MIYDFNHKLMFYYQAYRLNKYENEKGNQTNKRYCDGSMPKYLECEWNKERNEVKKYISNKLHHQ